MGSSINLSDIGTRLEPEYADFHRKTVADLLGRHSLNFPGAQPVSFARQHLEELKRTEYYMCEKTDGIRCLLYMTQRPVVDEQGHGVLDNNNNPRFQETTFLIDRKNDYYVLEDNAVHFPPFEWKTRWGTPEEGVQKWQINTIIDGELVRQTERDGATKLCYLIFDLLRVNTNSVMDQSLDRRLGKLNHFINQPYRQFAEAFPEDVAEQPFQIEMKKMEFSYATYDMFNTTIPNLAHGNDGLIFTCRTTPYVPGTDKHILKWKPPHENTIDFKLQLVSFPMVEDEDGEYEDWDAIPKYELLVNHGNGKDEVFALLSLTPTEWEAMKNMRQLLDHRIIECYKDSTTQQWRPKIEPDGTPRFRDDKTNANHISTVNSVLESIEDAISEEDLIKAAPGIKIAWKERERLKKVAEAEQKQRATAKHQQMKQQQQQQQQQQQPSASSPPRPVKKQEPEEDDDGPGYAD